MSFLDPVSRVRVLGRLKDSAKQDSLRELDAAIVREIEGKPFKHYPGRTVKWKTSPGYKGIVAVNRLGNLKMMRMEAWLEKMEADYG